MLDTPDGPGCMLHIQELGMAPPGVINALLKIRGEKGKLATDIQVHEDGGRLIESGEGFFLVMSTNPPGKGFKERFEVDSALARALVWKNLPNELSKESMEKVGERLFDFSKVERLPDAVGAFIDLCKQPELRKLIGAVVLRFHMVYQETDRSEPGRKQQIPPTIDSMWKVAGLLQNNQIPYDDRDGVNFIETIKASIRGIYIDCLRGKPNPFRAPTMALVAEQEKSLGSALLDQLDQILADERINPATVNGTKMSHAEAIEQLGDEAFAGTDTNQEMNSAQVAAQTAAAGVALGTTFDDLQDLLTQDQLNKLKNAFGL